MPSLIWMSGKRPARTAGNEQQTTFVPLWRAGCNKEKQWLGTSSPYPWSMPFWGGHVSINELGECWKTAAPRSSHSLVTKWPAGVRPNLIRLCPLYLHRVWKSTDLAVDMPRGPPQVSCVSFSASRRDDGPIMGDDRFTQRREVSDMIRSRQRRNISFNFPENVHKRLLPIAKAFNCP